MDELDTKIAQMEKRVEKLRAQVAELTQTEADLAALKRVRELLGGRPASNGLATSSSAKSENRNTLSIGDAVEQVLMQAGTAMHADEILPRVTELGLSPTKPTLVSAILKLTGKRFKALGRNTFALIDSQQDIDHTNKKEGEVSKAQND